MEGAVSTRIYWLTLLILHPQAHPQSIISICIFLIDLLLPLKEKEVDIVVALGQKVAQHSGGVTTADLIG